MRAIIGCFAALMGAMAIATGVMAAEGGEAGAVGKRGPSLMFTGNANVAHPKEKYDAAFSVCGAAVPVTHRDFEMANFVTPMSVITPHLFDKGIIISSDEPIVVTLTEAPKHGELISDGYTYGVYKYKPIEGYLGPDQMTFDVEVMGKKFKVIETVWVANVAPEYGGCPSDYKLPPATTGNDKRGGH